MTDLKRLVTLSDPTSSASEAYRSLRMNLQFAALDSPIRSLLVTSPEADENLVPTLVNLAITLAQVDQQVIVVDADLRRPAIHDALNVPNQEGLASMVLDDVAMANPPLQATGIDNLRVLTAGAVSSRPADVLSSKRMLQVIETLISGADIVLFSAPPVLVATDASLLAARVDACLMVVTAKKTRRDQVQRAKEQLSKARANLIGAVLCNAPSTMNVPSY